jgi:hypothetical protein
MSKGDKQRGSKEVKKPKKEAVKVLATADFNKGKTPLRIPEHPATHSDHTRPPVPTHSATCDALP